MAESERILHHGDTTRLIDSVHVGHPDSVHDVQRIGSINDRQASESQHNFYQRLSSSMSSVESSVVPMIKVYRRRWYILFIFTTLSFVQVKTPFIFSYYRYYVQNADCDQYALKVVVNIPNLS